MCDYIRISVGNRLLLLCHNNDLRFFFSQSQAPIINPAAMATDCWYLKSVAYL